MFLGDGVNPMPYRKNNTLYLIVVILMTVSIFICIGGCQSNSSSTTTSNTNNITSSSINYLTYEIKSDDIRFTWTNFPRFSFDYPDNFHLLDINDATEVLVTTNRIEIEFIDTSGAFRQEITIFIEEPWPGYYENASELVENVLTQSNWPEGSLVIKNVYVSGIGAHYIEFSLEPDQSGIQEKHRSVFFDYSGFIWQISMSTYSVYPEPLEIQMIFDHIINSFAFFE